MGTKLVTTKNLAEMAAKLLPTVDVDGKIVSAHDTDPERETFVPARLAATALRSAFVSVLVYTGGAYPDRPAGVPGGLVRYIGPVQPTSWLSGDEWVNNS